MNSISEGMEVMNSRIEQEEQEIIAGNKPVVYKYDKTTQTIVKNGGETYIKNNDGVTFYEDILPFILLFFGMLLALRFFISLSSYRFQAKQVEKLKKKLKKVSEGTLRYKWIMHRIRYNKFLMFGGCKNEMDFVCRECEHVCCPYYENCEEEVSQYFWRKILKTKIARLLAGYYFVRKF